MKITVTSDIRIMQVNLPDTAAAIATEHSLFAMLDIAVQKYYSEKDTSGKIEEKQPVEPERIETTETPEVYTYPTEQTPVQSEPKKYWGLFRIICPNCGNLHEFGVKRENSISCYRCNKCGEQYDLSDEIKLVLVDFHCPNCQESATIRTNDTNNTLNITCMSCKSPVDAFWNAKKRRYETEE